EATVKYTPLYPVHEERGAKIVDFAGWALPLQFSGALAEHVQVRERVGVFDCSHMGEFLVNGPRAIEALGSLTVADLPGLPPGRCRYTALLNETGGIIDDIVVLRLNETRLFVVTNAGPLDQVAEILTALPGVENLSDQTAKIDVQGPLSREVLLGLGCEAIRGLAYWTGSETTCLGTACRVTRGGYTGELGYELFLPVDTAVRVWNRLLEDPRVAACGLAARDTLRVEMSYPLSGQDFGPDTTPLEAGMERFIHWDHVFPGRERMIRARDTGDYARLVPVVSLDRRSPRHGFDLQVGDRPVGVVTSGTYGPSLGTGVGLARVTPDVAIPGTRLKAGPRSLELEVVAPPAYRKGTCRMNVMDKDAAP
ncbi:MAG TPA: glycine cleavage system aminomethyltransferase GcvT, partial [Candidatus Hydrogenedentes bacterium]|nr:glycine cleavage system aminomethyltransferase GcvT [Candidatus Hydrogenedentota bacterium]